MTEILEQSDCCGILLRPGPGDALRFCYAFSNLINIKRPINPVILISEYVRQNVLDLICFSAVIGAVSRTEPGEGYTYYITAQGVHIISFSDALYQLATWHLPAYIYVIFESPFVENMVNDFVAVLPVIQNCQFVLIDRIDSKRYISGRFGDFFPIRVQKKIDLRRILVTVRLEAMVPERNTPVGLFKEIIAYFSDLDIKVFYSGSEIKSINCLSGKEAASIKKYDIRQRSGFPNYLRQMEFYAAQFDGVVGVNSGGFDLAVAAGLPGIRVGAFHHLLPKHGKNFNAFLTSAPVVNIGASSEKDLKNITIDQFIQGFELLKSSLESDSEEVNLWL